MNTLSPWGLVKLGRNMARHDRTELPDMCDEQPLLFLMCRNICVWGSVKLVSSSETGPKPIHRRSYRVSHMQCWPVLLRGAMLRKFCFCSWPLWFGKKPWGVISNISRCLCSPSWLSLQKSTWWYLVSSLPIADQPSEKCIAASVSHWYLIPVGFELNHK